MSTLEFTTVGSGDPLLLVHGIGDTRAAWTTVLEPLARTHQVFAVDLPGFGASLPLGPDDTPSPQALARAVASWMDEHALEKVHVVGSSLGGWVALELAHLGRARTVLGLSPAGFASDREQRRARTMLRLARSTAMRLAPPHRGVSPRLRRVLSPAAMRVLTHSSMVAKPWRWPADEAITSLEALAAASGWDGTLSALEGVRYAAPADGLPVPVTLLWGAKDRLLPPSQRFRAREVLPHARTGVLPGCGHLPMWDDPDLVVRAVLDAASQTVPAAS